MCAGRCDWLIEFENVSFSYTGQEHGGLHDINLKISENASCSVAAAGAEKQRLQGW